jgi:hypothetical protein
LVRYDSRVTGATVAATQLGRRSAMRHFGSLFVALALVLVGFGAIRPSIIAQAGTPEALAARCPLPLATPTGRASGNAGRGGDLRRRHRG